MPRREPDSAVRPLTVQPKRDPRPRRLPATGAGVLLIIGAAAGYLLGLPNDTATPAAPPTSAALAAIPSSQTTADYEWREQQPSGEEAWAIYAAVELDEHIYLLVADDNETRTIRALWRSNDGTAWDRLSLDLGPDVTITDLDAYGSTLLLSGWNADVATIWRSQQLDDGGDPQWSETPLPRVGDGFGDLVGGSIIATEINESREIVVSTQFGIDVTKMLLGLPADGAVPNLLSYRELPEVAVADSRLWMRIVTADGSEEIHTRIIPSTIRVSPDSGSYGTEVRFLTAGALWTSTDGASFNTVELAEKTPVPSPQAFEDIFMSVASDPAGTHELWTSADGSAWSPSSWIAPPECGGWQGVAVGGPGLLLASDEFDTLCLSSNGTDWEVRPSPATAVSKTASVWVEGNDNGFLAFAGNSSESAVLTSSDGLHWDRVVVTGEAVGSRTFLIGDRLLTSSRPGDGSRPTPLVVWVGEPSDR